MSLTDKLKKEAHKKQFKNFLSLLSDYQDFHLQMYPKDMCLDERFEQLSADFDKGNKNIATYYANRTIEMLNMQLDKMITEKIFIIGICLTRKNITTQTLMNLIKSQLTAVSMQLLSLLGYDNQQDDKILEVYEVLEKQLFNQISIINGYKLSEDELNYIQRLQLIGQLPHHYESEKTKRGSCAIFDGIIDATTAGELKITSMQGEIFKTYLVLNTTPDYVDYCHLFEQSQNFKFPVEVHIKSRFKSNLNLQRKRQRHLLREKETAQDEREANISLSNKRLDNFKMLQQLGDELDSKKLFVE